MAKIIGFVALIALLVGLLAFFPVVDWLQAAVEWIQVNRSFSWPLGGLLIAIFIAWALPRNESLQELGLSQAAFRVWYTLLKYVAGPSVLIILVTGLA